MPYSYRDDAILGPALAYWQRICAGRTMPLKRELDPIDVPPNCCRTCRSSMSSMAADASVTG